jgi:hypothetical protein
MIGYKATQSGKICRAAFAVPEQITAARLARDFRHPFDFIKV